MTSAGANLYQEAGEGTIKYAVKTFNKLFIHPSGLFVFSWCNFFVVLKKRMKL